MKIKEKGITLIALIITVIILLILAGTAISISINGGDVFEKTSTARTEYNAKVAEEENSLLDAVDVLDMVVNPNLARHKLTVTVNEDGTIQSPYFVNYPSAKGTIKCRVLYNDRTYGLQIVSAGVVTSVRLGPNDPNPNVEGAMGSLERTINSYSRAVITLNEKAQEYMATADDSVLAVDARCIGSNPLDKDYPDNQTGAKRQALMFVPEEEDTYMNEYKDTFFDRTLKIAASDRKRLNDIKSLDLGSGNFYWLATHAASKNTYYGYSFGMNYMMHYETNDLITAVPSFRIDEFYFDANGVAHYIDAERWFRPVIKLADNVRIIGGEGTEEVPFELGV